MRRTREPNYQLEIAVITSIALIISVTWFFMTMTTRQ